MHRVRNVKDTYKWPSNRGFEVVVPCRTDGRDFETYIDWADQYDSEGLYYVGYWHNSPDRNEVLRKFAFTEEQDAIMFKLTFGGE